MHTQKIRSPGPKQMRGHSLDQSNIRALPAPSSPLTPHLPDPPRKS